MCQWKNFENRLILDEDMENDKVGRFLGHSVDFCASIYKCDTVEMYIYIYFDIFSNVFHARSQFSGLLCGPSGDSTA